MAFTLPEPLLRPLIRATGIGKPFKDADEARKHVRAFALRPQPYAPPRRIRRDVVIDVDRWRGWTVYRVKPRDTKPAGAVVYAHGGGWVNEMSFLHWHLVAELAAESATTFIVPIYPLIPFGTAAEVIARFVEITRETKATNTRTAIAGDSAGGQIALSTALELRDHHGITLDDTILISPALDLRFDNPEIPEVQPRDPILGVPGAQYFADIWRGDLPVTDPRVSPLLGDLRGLGRLLVLSGTDDILAPDIRDLIERLRAAGVPFDFYESTGQLHAYPLVPVPAGREARQVIAHRLQS
ncbi:alpha/beta hydrolase fold domain-containing protein [Granulicoccus sp. GXG6511]|uniref:alpha/beta hydrolase fold domain-containing protein n=1 Tax=Granulicoccus sp. GXG6511 TaxID=3381351 RepID=UPI003D7CFA2C